MEEHLKDLEAQDLLLTEFQDWKKLAHLYNKARFGHEVRGVPAVYQCLLYLACYLSESQCAVVL